MIMSENVDDEFLKLPAGKRIDLVLAVLGAMPVQEAGGWTLDALAEMAVVSRAAIHKREKRVLRKVHGMVKHLKEDFVRV